MSVAILHQGDYLIASIQSDLSDSQVLALRDDLAERVGRHRVRGLVVDVAALDVIDSFVARALRSLAITAPPPRPAGCRRAPSRRREDVRPSRSSTPMRRGRARRAAVSRFSRNWTMA
jgi:hypothetical protein